MNMMTLSKNIYLSMPKNLHSKFNLEVLMWKVMH